MDHRLGINLFGQRQLHQNAMDAGVGIESLNFAQQLRLRHAGIKLQHERMHADVFAGEDFIFDIDLTGRIVAHQDHGQAWCDAILDQLFDALAVIKSEAVRELSSVNDVCAHGWCVALVKRCVGVNRQVTGLS